MRTATVAAVVIVSAAALAVYRREVLPTVAADAVDEVMDMATGVNLADRNLQAFLKMIRYAEGTAGANGYRMLFGGRLFDSFADHPRVTVQASGYVSTAAGAYQILSRTWDEIRAGSPRLPDFSPASQDTAAARLIRRRGALADVYAGRFAEAVRKCAKEWASLPGSPYGQPVRTMAQVTGAYVGAGGMVA